MTVSLRLNKEDTELFKSYAAMNKISLSELFRNAVMEKIEDEYDLKVYEEAIAEYNKNPISYSLEDMKKELDL